MDTFCGSRPAWARPSPARVHHTGAKERRTQHRTSHPTPYSSLSFQHPNILYLHLCPKFEVRKSFSWSGAISSSQFVIPTYLIFILIITASLIYFLCEQPFFLLSKVQRYIFRAQCFIYVRFD